MLGNDFDPEGMPLTAQLVSGPTHGTLMLNADGSFNYMPSANYNGADLFWYRASDVANLGNAIRVTLTVNPVNDPPLAVADVYSVNEDNVLTIAGPGVLANDSDIDSPTLTASLVSGPSHGSLSFNADGSFSYTPTANYNGPDSFAYKANDGSLDSNVATVSITVNPVNDPPVAVNDAYSVNEDQTLTVAPTPGVTSLTMVSQAGDYIGQGQTYSYTPQTGTFMVSRNFDNGVSIYYSGGGHSWNLDFAAPFNAVLTPGYYANATRYPFQASGVPGLNVSGDGRGSNTLTGNFTVTQALYAADGTVLRFAATFEQHSEGMAPALTGTIQYNQGNGPSGILLNDYDVEGSPLSIVLETNPAHGTLGMNVDGSFTYKPAANYNGTDSFTYEVSHGSLYSNVATVAITVNPVNDPPTANNDSYVLAEDNVLTVTAPGVLANDSDIDGDPLAASLVTSPTHGSLAFHADGSFTYTPAANYNGTDSFQYAAFDGQAFSFIRTVTLTVTPVNDAPVAGNDSYTTAEDTPLSVSAAGVLGNDTDVDGDRLTAVLVSGPAHGTLTLGSNGSFVYTPSPNYNGPDSFTYKANDGSLDSNVVTLSLTITPVNDAPVAAGDSYSTAEDTPLTVSAPGVLGNDTDVDGDPLTAALASGPAHGTLTLSANGSFVYTPAANYNGSDSFTYKANDGSLDSNVATVSLTVTSVNDPPVAASDAYTIAEDTPLSVSASGVLGNDTDVDGDRLMAVLVSGPAHGTLALNSNGSFTYTPAANYNGSDSFTYKANDGQADSNIATVTLTITPVNDPPVVDAGPDQTANEGSTVAFQGTASDVDGDPLSYSWNFGDGATAAGAAPTHVYADNGTYTATLTVSDGQGGVTSDSLVVTVLNVAPTLTLSGASVVNEANTYTLNLAASDPGQDTIAGWTITWGDGNVQTVAGNPTSVTHTYADGPRTFAISATARDEDGTYNARNSLGVTVNNVAPTASLSGPATGASGQVRTFTLGAADPSAVDQAASFTFNINWGDGSSQPSTGSANQQVGHLYTTTGAFTVRITATDKDGGISAAVQQTITIKAVDVQSGTLVIGGTTGDDTISINPADGSGNLAVTINGVSQGTYSPPAQIVVYGQAGNDQIKLLTKKIGPTTYYVTVPAALFGDDGSDTLDARGSTANNILVGGAGVDTLQGGSGRDLLIGGTGADTVHGNGGDDIIIGNSTDFDTNLLALMAEWGRTDADYNTRINHLNGTLGGGLNGGYFLNLATVHDDAALDQLYGEAGSDWFFYTASGANKDKLNDLGTGEVATGQ